MSRVLVVDDDPLVRSALVMVLESVGDIEVVGEADDGDGVVAEVLRLRPDVVLMDVRMRRVGGVAATELVRALADAPAVLILTTFDADRHVLGALRAGAAGFLLKDTPPAQIADAVRRVAAGEPVMSPALVRRLMDRVAESDDDARRDRARDRLGRLTDREREVALAVGRGWSNAQIARELHFSVPTVKTHVSAVLAKLGLDNRVQIALLVHDAGEA